MTDSHTQQKGGDWIDIVWAAFENGLVNAEMYNALVLWADVEEQLGDPRHGGEVPRMREETQGELQPLDGGRRAFGIRRTECYVHWRDKDGSIHGTNMVTPVNFMAIAYGICDDPARRAAILDQIEDADAARETLLLAAVHDFLSARRRGRRAVSDLRERRHLSGAGANWAPGRMPATGRQSPCGA